MEVGIRNGNPFAALAMILALVQGLPCTAQTDQDKARIDYQAAKRALESGKYEIGLAKVEAVLSVLGEQPELFVIAAECALKLRDVGRAAKYVEKAFKAADPGFRASPAFERLVAIAADVELASTSRWKRTHASSCSMEYFPVTPTFSRRGRVSVELDSGNGSDSWTAENLETVSAITKDSVTMKGTMVASSVSDMVGTESQATTIRCDDKGVLAGSGYEIPAPLEVGTSWAFTSQSGSERCSAGQLEKIAIPAGGFDAIRVECVGTFSFTTSLKTSGGGTTYTTKWYVSGIGLARSQTRSSSTTQTGNGSVRKGRFSQDWELLAWTP